MSDRNIKGSEAAALSATATRLKKQQREKGIDNMRSTEDVKALKLNLGNASSALKDALSHAAARFEEQQVRAGSIQLSNSRKLHYITGSFTVSGPEKNGGVTLNKAIRDCPRDWQLEAAQAIPDLYNKLMRDDEMLLQNLTDAVDSVERFCDKLEGKSSLADIEARRHAEDAKTLENDPYMGEDIES